MGPSKRSGPIFERHYARAINVGVKHMRSVMLSVCLILAGASLSGATPRLAARYGQDCHLCHVNPTGGGMRNGFVTQFIGPSELPLKPLSAHEQERWPSPKISDQISVGLDMRLLYVAPDDVATGAGVLENTFYQMQGDLYLAFAPDPQFTIYMDRGLQSGFEVFVLARVLPAHGYLKAGQFVPDIGWRWDDHNHYTREKIGLDFPGATEAGLEAGFTPGHWVISAGIYNGAEGTPLDHNSQKAITGRVLYRLGLGELQTAFGGSMRLDHGHHARERLWGIQGQASWKSLSYITDAYGQRTEHADGDEERVWSWLFSQEIDLRPIQGLDFYVGYDFLDPDVDLLSGTQTQVSVGSRIYLRHFLKLEPMFKYEEGEVAPGRRTNSRFELLVHAFY